MTKKEMQLMMIEETVKVLNEVPDVLGRKKMTCREIYNRLSSKFLSVHSLASYFAAIHDGQYVHILGRDEGSYHPNYRLSWEKREVIKRYANIDDPNDIIEKHISEIVYYIR